jgi:hypothetical protein
MKTIDNRTSFFYFFFFKTLRWVMTVQKLYFPVSSTIERVKFDIKTKKITVDLPDDFASASGPRFIHVRHARALHYQGLRADIKLHGTVVSSAPYDNSYTCFCNEVLVKPKKYTYNTNRKTLEFWFADMFGAHVNVEAFVIELMLEWCSTKLPAQK